MGLGWDPGRSGCELWLRHFLAVDPWANSSFYKLLLEHLLHAKPVLSFGTTMQFLSSELKQITQDA